MEWRVAALEENLRRLEFHRHDIIAYAAYLRAEMRGFATGSELDDWLQAERAIRSPLLVGAAARRASALPP
jgi:hypothetical protein